MNKTLFMFFITSFLFIGCEDTHSDKINSISTLTFQNLDLSTMNSVAEINTTITENPSSNLSLAIRSSVVSEDINTTSLVTEDTEAIYPIFPINLKTNHFALPKSKKDQESYLAVSGIFTVHDLDGKELICNVIAGKYHGNSNVECLYTTTDLEDSHNIPVAVIRDGWVDGDLEDFDSVYFVVNNKSDGFKVYKYNGTKVYAVAQSETGKITILHSGKYAVFGYDATGETKVFIFRNEKNVFDVYTGPNNIHLPLIYKDLYMYLPSLFDLSTSSSTSYSSEVLIDCNPPLFNNQYSSHKHGVIWISNDTKKLCEAYELDRGTPIQLAFRFLDQTFSWEHVLVSNEVLVASGKLDGTNKLVIEPIVFEWSTNYPTDNNISIYDFENKIIQSDLDEITSLEHYIDGIVISGIKDQLPVSRYLNTKSGVNFEVPSKSSKKLYNRTYIIK